MADFLKSMSMAASGMAAQAARLRVTTENMANADTPGYQRKVMPFEHSFDTTTGTTRVKPGTLYLDQGEYRSIYDPNHPMSKGDGYVELSNVDVIVEMADAREAQRSYEANVKMFDQARQMSSSLLDLHRR